MQRLGFVLLVLLLAISGVGCAGLIAQNTVPPSGNGQLGATPASVSFGDVEVGTSSTQTVSISNSGSTSLTVSQAGVSGAGFTVSGLTLPLTLPAGQWSTLSVQFTPAITGSVSGSVSVVSNASNSPTMISLKGNGVRHQLSVTPASVSFGNVVVGTTGSQTITLTNSGTANLNISQGTVTGAGFSLSGLNFPVTLASGQSTTLSVQFAPTAIGSASGSLTLISNAPQSPAVVPLAGTGIQPASGQLTANPSNIIFGNVMVASTSTQTVTLTNTGSSGLSISQVNVTGAGFSASGLSLPLNLAAGQSTALNVAFAPTAPGNVAGSASVVSNGTNSPTIISLSGVGVQPQIAILPPSVNFGNVAVGFTSTQTMTLSNPGSATLSVSQATLSGTAFAFSGLTLPLNVAPGQSTAFTVSFTPTVAGSATGTLSLVSNAPTSPTTIALSGTGAAPILQLSASPASLSFGNVALGSSSTQTVTLTNTGNSNVSISQISVSGAGFTTSGLTPPVTIGVGQTANLNVVFTPTTPASVSGSVTVTSNATNSPAIITLSGSAHSVALSWSASTSVVVGYNIYRAAASGGPYTKLNSSPVPVTTYTDIAIQSGQTFFYVTTAVDSNNVESGYSNEVSATIP